MRGRPSHTAEIVAFVRAWDHAAPPGHRIVDDPLAAAFLGPGLRALLALVAAMPRVGLAVERSMPGIAGYALARHRFIDERLSLALREGRAEQVLLLGAGYDTRAWRLAGLLGERPLIELDHPATSARKQRIARERLPAPPAGHRSVAADLEAEPLEAALARGGFDPALSTFAVWEGVSMYLAPPAVHRTLASLAGIAPGALLAMDFWNGRRQPIHGPVHGLLRGIGEPLRFGMDPSEIGGLSVVEPVDVAGPDELEPRYLAGRRPCFPDTWVLVGRLAG